MKDYDPNIDFGVHKVRVKFQVWDYIGHLTFEAGGNCKGRDILNFEFEECENNIIESDCYFEIIDNEDNDSFRFGMVLKNSNGENLDVEDELDCLKDMIVAVEIINFERECEDI